MIQLQFASVKNAVPSLPLVPSSSATSSSANIPTAPIFKIGNHRRRGQFTDKIIKHGGTSRDTSISAASKSKQRQKIQFEKSVGSLDEMMEEFEREREEIIKLQETIMKNQKNLAKHLLKWYAAISIQMKWRSYIAKRTLLKLKAARLITRWARFRHYYRKLCRAAGVINRRVKTLMARRRYLKFIKYHRAAKIIQRNVRKKLDWFHWLFAIFKLSRMKRFIDHILLFGGRRAIKVITDGTKKQQEARIVGRAFLRSCARRKRLKMLRGPQGKIAFYVLSRFYVSNGVIPYNKVIEYLRRRVLTQEDKTRRRVNLSMKQVTELNMKSKVGNKGKGSPNKPGGHHSPYVSPAQQQQERQLQQQLLQQQQQQELYYQSQAALFTADDLPPYFHGVYAPRGVADVMILIQDLYEIALQNPTYLDDSIVPTHPSTTVAAAATSPGGRKGRQREGQMANPKHLLSVASAASTTLSTSSGSGKMKGIGRSTSSEDPVEASTARNSLTGPSSTTSVRHPTTYNQATSGVNHPKNKFVKKDTIVAHHGTSNHSEITSHLSTFTPMPPSSTRSTEIGRSPHGRLTGAVPSRTPLLRSSTASDSMRAMIIDILEDEEDESPKSVKRNESINTDTSDEDEDESKKGTMGSRSGSPKDQFDREKPLMGKAFSSKIKQDNLGNTPMTTPRTTQLEGNFKVHNSLKRPSKVTNNASSLTTAKRQSVLQKESPGNTSKQSNTSVSQKRMSKPVNKATAAIIANIPPLSLMNPKDDLNEEEKLPTPSISTPQVIPLLHPGEVATAASVSSPANSKGINDSEIPLQRDMETINDTAGAQPAMASTLNSTLSSTLAYSDSEDESSPFKDMKGKKFSNSALPPPNTLFNKDSQPLETSELLVKEDIEETEPDDFISDVLSPSGTSLLQFDIPETTMVELLGTGFHLGGKE